MGGYPYNAYSYGYGDPYAPPPVRPIREPDPMIEARLHSLEMACAGLWELLKQKYGYTDQELMDVIKQVDQRRAAQANSPTSDANVCPKCGHKMLTHNHNKCLWCGADLAATPFQPQ